MICRDIWEQHEMTFRVAGCELRFLRFKDHSRAMGRAGLTSKDLAFFQRLKLKRKAGVEAITPDEEQRERSIMQRWPLRDTHAACFVHPVLEDGRRLETFLNTLPRDDRLTLELWLERLIDPNPQGVYGLEDIPLIGALGLQISRTLDYSTMTLQQATLLLRALNATAEAAKSGPAQLATQDGH